MKKLTLVLAVLVSLASGCDEQYNPCAEGTYEPGPPRECVLEDGTRLPLDPPDAGSTDGGPTMLPDSSTPDAGRPDSGSTDACVLRRVYRDADGDGHGDPTVSMEACSVEEGWVQDDTDCDDTCGVCWSGAAESCDMEDNDCDGSVDEGALTTFYRDADGDAHGSITETVEACSMPDGYVEVGDDCNDACTSCHPGGSEVCEGSLDENCMGGVDEGCACTLGTTRPCGSAVGECRRGTQTCGAAGWGACSGAIEPAVETCNTRDDDCDSRIDEMVQTTYYRDADGDTYGVTSMTMLACSMPSGYASRGGDCNDTTGSVRPGAVEICDGTIDHDCDGVPDLMDGCACLNGATRACPGGMTVGECRAGTQTCTSGAWASCVGRVDPVAESCNTRDDDCDSRVDEMVQTTYYRDADGDGRGTSATTMAACSMPTGYVLSSDDCNDMAMTTYPGAPELCNGVDDDCDVGGTADEGFACVQGASVSCTTTCGTTGTGACTASCAVPTGVSCTPPAETCNYVDDDCDGNSDEGLNYNFLGTIVPVASATGSLQVVSTSTGLRAFWRSGSTLQSVALDASGAPTGSVSTLVTGISTSAAFAVGRGVDAHIWVATVLAANRLQVRRFRPSDLALVSGPHNITGFGVAVGYLNLANTALWARVDGNLLRYQLRDTGALDATLTIGPAASAAFVIGAAPLDFERHYVTYVSSDGRSILQRYISLTSYDPLTYALGSESTLVSVAAGTTIRSVARVENFLAWSEASSSTRRISIQGGGWTRIITTFLTTPASGGTDGPSLLLLPRYGSRTGLFGEPTQGQVTVIAQAAATISATTGSIQAWDVLADTGVPRALTLPANSNMARPGGFATLATGGARYVFVETAPGQLSTLAHGCF